MLVGISSPNFYSGDVNHVMNFGPQTKSYCAHIDTPEVLVRCKLTQVHTPRVLGYRFWSRLLALLREEFRISKLTLHSDLLRRAASRRALPCPSSLFILSPRVIAVKLGHVIGNCLNFIVQVQKFAGALPQKNLGPKTCKISVDIIQPPTLITNIS